MSKKEEAITQGELIYYADKLDTKFEEIDIVPISDVHYGNPLFSKKHFLRTLKFLERPNAYGFLNGDLCLVPETKVLRGDLSYIKLGDVKVGDELIGVTEYPLARGRKIVHTTVTAKGSRRARVLKISLEDGTELIATPEHPWLVDGARSEESKGRYNWLRTDKISKGDKLIKVFPVWDTSDNWVSGYIAGLLDGEGSICLRKGRDWRARQLAFSQQSGLVLSFFEDYLSKNHISYQRHSIKKSGGKEVFGIIIRTDAPKLLGATQPLRLAEKAYKLVEKKLKNPILIGVDNIQPLGEREVITIETDAHTFIAEGLATHNCESTLRTSKGEIYNQVGSPEEQRDNIIDWLKPYKEKLIGAVDGNHENRIWKEAGIHLMRDIAKELGIPYRPAGLLHKISFGDGNRNTKGKPFVFWFYQTHGYGGARTKSAKAVKVERTSHWIHADFYCMCLSDDSEILTERGWCKFDDLRGGENVLTLCQSTGMLEYQPIQKIHSYEYEGEMLHLLNRNIDILATPNHRMIYSYANGYLEKPFYEFLKLKGSVAIPRSGHLNQYTGVDYTDDFLRLMAWIITEGHFRTKPYGDGIDIKQSADSPYCGEIEALLNRLAIHYGKYRVATKGKSFRDKQKIYHYNSDAVTFHIHADSGRMIRGHISEKRIPSLLQRMNEQQFKLFLDELLKGDGYVGKVTNYTTKDIVLASQLQALCFKHGIKVTINRYQGKSAYTLVLSSNKSKGIIPSGLTTKENYRGKVWCVTTANGNFVARRNGRAFVTGNSHDHVVNVAPDVYLLPDPRTWREMEYNKVKKEWEETGFTIGRVKAHRKMLVKTNAYLKWGGYSEFGGFPPTDMATPLIRLLTPKSKHWEGLPDKPRQAVKVIV